MWNDCQQMAPVRSYWASRIPGECYRGRSVFQVRWTGALRIIPVEITVYFIQTSVLQWKCPDRAVPGKICGVLRFDLFLPFLLSPLSEVSLCQGCGVPISRCQMMLYTRGL